MCCKLKLPSKSGITNAAEFHTDLCVVLKSIFFPFFFSLESVLGNETKFNFDEKEKCMSGLQNLM